MINQVAPRNEHKRKVITASTLGGYFAGTVIQKAARLPSTIITPPNDKKSAKNK